MVEGHCDGFKILGMKVVFSSLNIFSSKNWGHACTGYHMTCGGDLVSLSEDLEGRYSYSQVVGRGR